MLHILFNSPYQISLNSLKIFSQSSDEIICLQDGVILGIKKKILDINFLDFFHKVYCLEEDLKARGLFKFVIRKVCIINFLGFVKLTEKHKINMTW
ncbi:sulfurtransferase complex subunit TusB [Buchnera aphidicola]|uniref:Protein TusB n=1 Tax=Buchnera aphidicola subsp. Tuberolachnus salignus TaxID=98804 RepID=A0A160SW62_BUCTT|nr:sulfurtransferase complex subunit TusB [Buchnera aphidicola]CUR53327.1 Protein TusB [Buchnera aphidicola (Tuberolachnus salignus)]